MLCRLVCGSRFAETRVYCAAIGALAFVSTGGVMTAAKTAMVCAGATTACPLVRAPNSTVTPGRTRAAAT